jgi:hypothetical protein
MERDETRAGQPVMIVGSLLTSRMMARWMADRRAISIRVVAKTVRRAVLDRAGTLRKHASLAPRALAACLRRDRPDFGHADFRVEARSTKHAVRCAGENLDRLAGTAQPAALPQPQRGSAGAEQNGGQTAAPAAPSAPSSAARRPVGSAPRLGTVAEAEAFLLQVPLQAAVTLEKLGSSCFRNNLAVVGVGHEGGREGLSVQGEQGSQWR